MAERPIQFVEGAVLRKVFTSIYDEYETVEVDDDNDDDNDQDNNEDNHDEAADGASSAEEQEPDHESAVLPETIDYEFHLSAAQVKSMCQYVIKHNRSKMFAALKPYPEVLALLPEKFDCETYYSTAGPAACKYSSESEQDSTSDHHVTSGQQGSSDGRHLRPSTNTIYEDNPNTEGDTTDANQTLSTAQRLGAAGPGRWNKSSAKAGTKKSSERSPTVAMEVIASLQKSKKQSLAEASKSARLTKKPKKPSQKTSQGKRAAPSSHRRAHAAATEDDLFYMSTTDKEHQVSVPPASRRRRGVVQDSDSEAEASEDQLEEEYNV